MAKIVLPWKVLEKSLDFVLDHQFEPCLSCLRRGNPVFPVHVPVVSSSHQFEYWINWIFNFLHPVYMVTGWYFTMNIKGYCTLCQRSKYKIDNRLTDKSAWHTLINFKLVKSLCCNQDVLSLVVLQNLVIILYAFELYSVLYGNLNLVSFD